MEAARVIRLVAVFVVGVVLAMGGAMIYAVASNAGVPKAPFRQTAQQAAQISNSAVVSPSVAATQQAPSSDSVIEVPVPGSDQVSEAYVESPETTVVKAQPAPEPEPTASQPRPTQPASPAPSATLNAANPPLPQPVREATLSTEASASQPSTTGPRESPAAVNVNAPTRAPIQPRSITLWSGTPVSVKLSDTLTTDGTKKGEFFRARLAAPIIRDGFVLAESGSAVTGQVIESKHAGVFGRAPDLRLALVQIRTTDNQDVHIATTSWNDQGRGHNPVTGTVRSVFGAVSDVVALPVMRGHALVVPANTILEFQLAAPVVLTEHTH